MQMCTLVCLHVVCVCVCVRVCLCQCLYINVSNYSSHVLEKTFRRNHATPTQTLHIAQHM